MDAIENRIKAIHDNLNHWMTPEILKSCLGMTDLTSLKSTDTCASIRKLTEKVNDFQKRFPDYPLPASICVYPNFAKTVRQTLTVPGVHTTVVAGCFPASQSFLEVKVLESRMAVADGADEAAGLLVEAEKRNARHVIDPVAGIYHLHGIAHRRVDLPIAYGQLRPRQKRTRQYDKND